MRESLGIKIMNAGLYAVIIGTVVGCSGAVGPDEYNPYDLRIRNGAVDVDEPDSEVVSTTVDSTVGPPRDFDGNTPTNADLSDAGTVGGAPDFSDEMKPVGGQGPMENTRAPARLFLWEILADPTGDGSDLNTATDWLEIHNPSDEPISLTQWTVRRIKPGEFEPDIDDKVFAENVQVMAGQYLVVWAYKDGDPGPDGLNAGFKLSKAGMVRLELLNPTGDVVDAVTYPAIEDGASYARQSLDSNDWLIVEPEQVSRGAPNPAP
ncbi:MAG: lamin tail domain-containing protein [Myxococcota bacterium]|nr:lamin tail domain-containing protein [Myxococcota bacterium]